MMVVSSGMVRVSKGSREEEEFDILCSLIKGLSDELLVKYHNELIALGEYGRGGIQNMMLDAIAYCRGQVKLERI